jgi:glycosyltransferase involved in cell wall biosynthesis
MITFNHEPYIREAIEGVLMQQCNFPIELIIGEDCSDDKTRQICQEYATNYSEINLLSSESNLGMMTNFIRTLQACTGKYMALCEGDDFWTDPLKLQKQVDFLEANEDYVLCAHSVDELDENNKFIRILKPDFIKNGYTYRDININLTIWTCSVVFRNCIKEMPQWLSSLPAGDFPLWLLLSKYGDIKYLDETMSVYRNNNSGVHSSLSRIEKIINGLVLIKKMKIRFNKDFQKYFKDLEKLYSNYFSNEIFKYCSQDHYSKARKSIILLFINKLSIRKIHYPKFKVLLSIIIGDKLRMLLMAAKGKRVSKEISK